MTKIMFAALRFTEVNICGLFYPPIQYQFIVRQQVRQNDGLKKIQGILTPQKEDLMVTICTTWYYTNHSLEVSLITAKRFNDESRTGPNLKKIERDCSSAKISRMKSAYNITTRHHTNHDCFMFHQKHKSVRKVG